MPRPPSLIPMRHLHTTIPQPLWDQLEERLFSNLEGTVPRGDLQNLIIQLLRRHLTWQELDLSPFLLTMPGEATVLADPRVCELLIKYLKGESNGAD